VSADPRDGRGETVVRGPGRWEATPVSLQRLLLHRVLEGPPSGRAPSPKLGGQGEDRRWAELRAILEIFAINHKHKETGR